MAVRGMGDTVVMVMVGITIWDPHRHGCDRDGGFPWLR